ncbi:MAG: hypothetical protein WAW41_09770 [Methylobacter sp.]
MGKSQGSEQSRLKAEELISIVESDLAKLVSELNGLLDAQRELSNRINSLQKWLEITRGQFEIPTTNEQASFFSNIPPHGDDVSFASAVHRKRTMPIPTSDGTSRGRLKERVKTILMEAGKPMRLSEITQEFRARGWELSDKYGMEVIRQIMKKNPDEFRKISKGLYELIK